MKKWRNGMGIPLVLVIALALIHTLFQDRSNHASPFQAGKAAPDFSAVLTDGSEVKLSDYRGKGVLLNFWGTWCEPCVHELPRLNEAYRAVPGVELLAVNAGESKGSMEEFAVSHGLTFPMVQDPSGETADQYGVTGLPATFLIDAHGRFVKRVDGELASTEDVLRLMEQIQP
ncbi:MULTISPECIES: redoxin domain-containing protein [Paenibacillus]|uniref:redoxin domain-containing protein n=1 Tax=Paenibacillus TaxID=44249 RepID=UPI0022B924A2|nr:redoxin domain-containing protein [Paenibacillus caseinilyticus]MCZ8523042.1 redoxin domain-containing protein [Paenibacillus caseinilyticus]